MRRWYINEPMQAAQDWTFVFDHQSVLDVLVEKDGELFNALEKFIQDGRADLRFQRSVYKYPAKVGHVGISSEIGHLNVKLYIDVYNAEGDTHKGVVCRNYSVPYSAPYLPNNEKGKPQGYHYMIQLVEKHLFQIDDQRMYRWADLAIEKWRHFQYENYAHGVAWQSMTEKIDNSAVTCLEFPKDDVLSGVIQAKSYWFNMHRDALQAKFVIIRKQVVGALNNPILYFENGTVMTLNDEQKQRVIQFLQQGDGSGPLMISPAPDVSVFIKFDRTFTVILSYDYDNISVRGNVVELPDSEPIALGTWIIYRNENGIETGYLKLAPNAYLDDVLLSKKSAVNIYGANFDEDPNRSVIFNARPNLMTYKVYSKDQKWIAMRFSIFPVNIPEDAPTHSFDYIVDLNDGDDSFLLPPVATHAVHVEMQRQLGIPKFLRFENGIIAVIMFNGTTDVVVLRDGQQLRATLIRQDKGDPKIYFDNGVEMVPPVHMRQRIMFYLNTQMDDPLVLDLEDDMKLTINKLLNAVITLGENRMITGKLKLIDSQSNGAMGDAPQGTWFVVNAADNSMYLKLPPAQNVDDALLDTYRKRELNLFSAIFPKNRIISTLGNQRYVVSSENGKWKAIRIGLLEVSLEPNPVFQNLFYVFKISDEYQQLLTPAQALAVQLHYNVPKLLKLSEESSIVIGSGQTDVRLQRLSFSQIREPKFYISENAVVWHYFEGKKRSAVKPHKSATLEAFFNSNGATSPRISSKKKVNQPGKIGVIDGKLRQMYSVNAPSDGNFFVRSVPFQIWPSNLTINASVPYYNIVEKLEPSGTKILFFTVIEDEPRRAIHAWYTSNYRNRDGVFIYKNLIFKLMVRRNQIFAYHYTGIREEPKQYLMEAYERPEPMDLSQCRVCSAVTLHACGGCKKVAYCNNGVCQRKDWIVHRKECKQ